MQNKISIFFLGTSFSFLLGSAEVSISSISSTIEGLIGTDTFIKNRPLITKIFTDEDKFLSEGKPDPVLIASRLKKNGLLKLNIGKTQPVILTFYGIGSYPIFAKVLFETIAELGYSKYRIISTASYSTNIVIQIEVKSDSILDPELLSEILQKDGCNITSIKKDANNKWSYQIDTSTAELDVTQLKNGSAIQLPTPITDYWLAVEKNGILDFISSGNEWYPFISFYDKKLSLLQSFRLDKKHETLTLKVPKSVKYIRVSDMYQLNNIKTGLRVRFE